jgi:hypothetical protein
MQHLRLVHSVPASRPTNIRQAAVADLGSCADAGCADRSCPVDDVGPEVRTLLEHVRALTPLPNVVRARALVRARAALAAASSASPRAGQERARRPSWATLLVATALASAFGTAAGALLARRSNVSASPAHATASSPIAAFEAAASGGSRFRRDSGGAVR